MEAIIKIQAIRHCLSSPFAMVTDDNFENYAEENDSDDVVDSPSHLMSVNKKGFLIAPQAMHTVLQDSLHPTTVRINAMFCPAPVSSDEMDCAEGKTDLSGQAITSAEESKEMIAASQFSQINSLQQPQSNIYKKKESSHQNFDSDLQRTCKVNSCRKNCRNFERIFTLEMARNRINRLRQVSECTIFNFSRVPVHF